MSAGDMLITIFSVARWRHSRTQAPARRKTWCRQLGIPILFAAAMLAAACGGPSSEDLSRMAEYRATTDGSQWRCEITDDELRDETVASLATDATEHNLGHASPVPVLRLTIGPSKQQSRLPFSVRRIDVSASMSWGDTDVSKGHVRTEYRVDDGELHTSKPLFMWFGDAIRWKSHPAENVVKAEAPRLFIKTIRYGAELHIRAYDPQETEVGTAKFNLSQMDRHLRRMEHAFEADNTEEQACEASSN